MRAFSITLLLTLCLLVTAAVLPRILANRYRNQLHSVSDQRAAVLVDKVARLGKPGIPVLAEALGSPRERVASAAGQSLREEMGRWDSLPVSASSRRLQLLAEALAEQVQGYGPTSRTEAAELVREILRRHLDGDVVDRSQVAANCAKVLYATTLERRLSAEKGLLGETEYTNVGGESSALRRTVPAPDSPGGFQIPRILPDETHTAPLAKPTQPETQPSPSQLPRLLDQPRRILQPELARALPKFAGPAPVDDAGRQALPDAWESRHVRPPESFPPSSPPSEDLTVVDTVSLMRRLQSPDEWVVDGAEGELIQRGFTRVHLDLARRLFHPDPQTRKQLVQLLPTIPNLNAVSWLMELSRDADPQVRLAAITLMATSGEPTLMSQLRRVFELDPDLTVRRRAGEILR